MCPKMSFEMVTGSESFATPTSVTLVGFLASMSTSMLSQIAERGEKLQTTADNAIKSIATVQALMSLETVQCIERFFTTRHCA